MSKWLHVGGALGRRLRLVGVLTLTYGALAFGVLWLGDLSSPTFRAARNFYTPEAVGGYPIPGPGAKWRRPARPLDPWGNPWIETQGVPARSRGPNGIDEGGGGDDVVLRTTPLPVCYPAIYLSALPLPCWWALAICLSLGHLARNEAAADRRGAALLASGVSAALTLVGLHQVLDHSLWIQAAVLAGWVYPPEGQLGYLLEAEYATGSGFLPTFGIPASRAGWVVAGSAWGALFLWIEFWALAAAWRGQRHSNQRAQEQLRGQNEQPRRIAPGPSA